MTKLARKTCPADIVVKLETAIEAILEATEMLQGAGNRKRINRLEELIGHCSWRLNAFTTISGLKQGDH